MSATTQDDSFFVKALGISIEAIKNPIVNEDLKWSGEKMILIPSLIASEFTRDVLLEYLCKKKSQRPDKTIKRGPDNLWGTGNNHYIMIECKSEVSQERKNIHKSEVGQMNNHCGWFINEYSDATVLRIMVIPTICIAFDANFTHEVKILRKMD